MTRAGIIFIVICLISTCCNTGNKNAAVVERRSIVTCAERFLIEKKDGFTLLRIINPWQGAGNIEMSYYLVRRGSDLPAGTDSSDVIFVPVRKVVCMSVTHLAMISALDEINSVAAVSGSGLIYSESTRSYIEKNNIPDVGYEAGLNNELILKISPDLVMMYGIGGESTGYAEKLKELGIKVLFNADYLENEPVAKAEWIKLFGALYCKEMLADSLFRAEKQEYEAVCRITENSNNHPKVMLGLPFRDTWYISPGNSYVSRLISDAGGDYLWKDSKASVAMPLAHENVYSHALNADYWLNPGTAFSRSEILSVDPRFADLPCFIDNNVFNNTKRTNPTGGNDYWEEGAVHPHLILRDIAMILHPELFGDDDELYFYRKLE
ncbi:MAG TPA: ABC transporter substrate-binding protein [Bacteroidales bacterium]|nr:ABC transporter substrate-binding protein [Bacteroidales bacterium]